MKVTVRVEITTDWDEKDTFEICQLERPYRKVEPEGIGLSLAKGKDVLHRLQKVVVAAPLKRSACCDAFVRETFHCAN